MVGSALVKAMSSEGHDVSGLVRPESKSVAHRKPSSAETSVVWDPLRGTLGGGADAADAIVHLAGASIAGGRWTAARKRVLRDSRVAATRDLAAARAQL